MIVSYKLLSEYVDLKDLTIKDITASLTLAGFEIEGVTSYSVGTDANRRVVIALAEGYKATNPSRGGYNNRRGGKGGYNRGGKGRNNRRPSAAASTTAPTRAPRTDAGAEKVSLYGKIN